MAIYVADDHVKKYACVHVRSTLLACTAMRVPPYGIAVIPGHVRRAFDD